MNQQHDAVRLILTTTMSNRQIGLSTSLSKTTVRRYRTLADIKKLVWNDVRQLDAEQTHMLFNPPPPSLTRKRVPDFEKLHERLQTRGMTLQLLWEEYCAENPGDSLCYSHLAAKMQHYRKCLPSVMRQSHVAGERAFTDYSGKIPRYFDVRTGKFVPVQLFVGVLPASSLMFALCTPSQTVPDFIQANVAMLHYFGGLPQILRSDNLKAAVLKRIGDTIIYQPTYADLARHYNLGLEAARPYRPKDKASVEVSVKVAQQRVLMRLQHMTFYSLDELNAAIAKLLEEVNDRPMRKDKLSRRQRFNAMERDTLRPLPPVPYVYADYTAIPKVPQDYHVCIQGHFYSVPNRLVGEKLEARTTEKNVEILHHRKRVALHVRGHVVGGHTTLPEHQTDGHRAQGERTPEHLLAWGKEAGAHLLRFVQVQLSAGSHPALGLPACEQAKRLAKVHGTAMVDAAARQAFALNSPKISTLRRVLSNQTKAASSAQRSTRHHSNVRGPAVFAGEAQSC